MSIVVEQFAREQVGRVRVGVIDIDESPETSTRFGVRGAPTLVVFRRGKEVARHVGLTTKARLVELVRGEA